MSQRPTAQRVVAWILALLLAVSFVPSSWPKLVPGESMVQRFQAWGYPVWFPSVVGAMEGLGGLLVLLPATVLYGAALLVAVMLGATATHFLTGIGSPAFALLYLVLAAALAYLRREDAWHRRA